MSKTIRNHDVNSGGRKNEITTPGKVERANLIVTSKICGARRDQSPESAGVRRPDTSAAGTKMKNKKVIISCRI
jgi:hypothetical protein